MKTSISFSAKYYGKVAVTMWLQLIYLNQTVVRMYMKIEIMALQLYQHLSGLAVAQPHEF